MMDALRFSSIGFLLALCCGCGNEAGGPTLVEVSGKVTWNGKPLSGSLVTLVPMNGTGGWGAQATTNENGEYKLIEGKSGRPGVQAGTYRVVISRRTMPDGSAVPKDDPTPPIESPASESLPPEYSDLKGTKLKVTIPSEGGVFDFPLKGTETLGLEQKEKQP